MYKYINNIITFLKALKSQLAVMQFLLYQHIKFVGRRLHQVAYLFIDKALLYPHSVAMVNPLVVTWLARK
jgi:hypothetical protein